MKIVDMKTLSSAQRLQAAEILTDELPLGWPTLADAEAEINERWSGEPGALFLAAVDVASVDCGATDRGTTDNGAVDDATVYEGTIDDTTVDDAANNNTAENSATVDGGAVIGWCGILPRYGGNVYELHPLAVRRDWQRKGVGTALVRAIESAARERGALTLWVGADDEKPGGETSFAGVDLYDDLPRQIREFEPGTHQTAFYLKQGFRITGVMPDANGAGKPDIYLAKRLYIQVDESTLEDTLSYNNQIKFTHLINNMRSDAQKNGSHELSLDEINNEIAKTRQERRERATE